MTEAPASGAMAQSAQHAPAQASLLDTWPRAMTVPERARAVQAGYATEPAAARRAAARARVRMWQEVPGLESREAFERRLSLFGIQGVQQLRDVLSAAVIQEAPAWVRDIFAAYGDAADPFPGMRAELAEKLAANASGTWQLALDSLAEPLFARKLAEHGDAVRQEASGRGARAEVELILGARPKGMYRYLAGAFVLRMHLIERNSPGIWDFPAHLTDFLSQPNFLGLAGRYPVLARALAGAVDAWARAQTQLARRYLADRDLIAALPGMPGTGFTLAEVSPWLGDPHRGLQTVHLLTGADGSRVIYKPTDCRVFDRLSALLAWVSSEDARLGFRVPAAVVRDGYGWVEYVSRQPCDAAAEVPAFYQRMGSMIAIAWLLGASDLHSDNLIACGSDPVMVDLESAVGVRAGDYPWTRGRFAQAMMTGSVLGTGLLPALVKTNTVDPVDLSGVGARGGQRLTLDAWVDAGTTKMHMGSIEVEQSLLPCAPYRPGVAPVQASDFAADIEAGFRKTCLMFLNKQSRLVSDSALLRNFGDSRYRVLLRSTAIYAQIGNNLNHPDLLAEGADRDRHLDHMLTDHIGDAAGERIGEAERASIDCGDIPYFAVEGNSRDLLANDSTLIPDYFEVSPAEALLERVATLNADEINRQTWFLRTSLVTSDLNRHPDDDFFITCCSQVPGEVASGAIFTEAITKISARIMELRYDDHPGGIAWPSIRSVQGRDWQIVPVGNSLYDGTAGIALYLALAADLLGDAQLASVARRCLEPLIREVREGEAAKLGAYEGAAGQLYALTCLEQVSGEDYCELKQKLLHLIRDGAAHDVVLDVIGGIAGAGLVIANCIERLPAELALEAARACAERIKAAKIETGDGIVSWAAAGEPSLTGFAHGAAGISLACSALGALLDDDDLHVLSVRAQNFESTHFHAEQQSWADLRPAMMTTSHPDGSVARVNAWCNGAAGIGMARCLAAARDIGHGVQEGRTRTVEQDIRTALGAARLDGLGNSHCLCHGDLGVMELHFAASRLDGLGEEREYGNRIAAMVARQVIEDGPVCGVPPGIVIPGLMSGLAGIGLGLLRGSGRDVPNVLALTL